MLSNHLRPASRSVPIAALAALTALDVLDLRFNSKLPARRCSALLAQHLPPGCRLLLTESDAKPTPSTAGGTCGYRAMPAPSKSALLLKPLAVRARTVFNQPVSE